MNDDVETTNLSLKMTCLAALECRSEGTHQSEFLLLDTSNMHCFHTPRAIVSDQPSSV